MSYVSQPKIKRPIQFLLHCRIVIRVTDCFKYLFILNCQPSQTSRYVALGFNAMISYRKKKFQPSLNGKVNLVLFAPFDLGPDTLESNHEGCLENSIGSSNLTCHGKVLRDEEAYSESIANGKQSPNQSLGQ
mmetsp:Transcript_28226/g.43243  ORF Transcript_28226/g.43243 Transcript_28226/m.43243 type:complete len:132 (+) Transcript_28226:370-765(+)